MTETFGIETVLGRTMVGTTGFEDCVNAVPGMFRAYPKVCEYALWADDTFNILQPQRTGFKSSHNHPEVIANGPAPFRKKLR